MLTFSRSFHCERVKEERGQEISRYQLFAPSEMALTAMRAPGSCFSQVSLRSETFSGPGKFDGMGIVTVDVAAHWTPRASNV